MKKSYKSAKQDIRRFEDLGKMKKQRFNRPQKTGGMLFPSSKTSYMETNTQKDEEMGISRPRQHSHVPSTHFCAPEHMMKRLTPENLLTCT